MNGNLFLFRRRSLPICSIGASRTFRVGGTDKPAWTWYSPPPKSHITSPSGGLAGGPAREGGAGPPAPGREGRASRRRGRREGAAGGAGRRWKRRGGGGRVGRAAMLNREGGFSSAQRRIRSAASLTGEFSGRGGAEAAPSRSPSSGSDEERTLEEEDPAGTLGTAARCAPPRSSPSPFALALLGPSSRSKVDDGAPRLRLTPGVPRSAPPGPPQRELREAGGVPGALAAGGPDTDAAQLAPAGRCWPSGGQEGPGMPGSQGG